MPTISPETSLPRDLVLRAIRDARFAGGIRCPRCASDQAHRWGAFTGRQRYRCRNCRRTFSDLTGTATAYSKKLELWPRYFDCMAKASTVRQAAAYTGIHCSTSFRWRHAILGSIGKADQVTLRGLVELEDTRLVYSEKGQRNLKRPPRQRGIGKDLRRKFESRLVNVTVAYDRRGVGIAMITGSSRVDFAELHTRLLPRLRDAKVLISAHGRISPYGAVACRAAAAYHMARRHNESPRDLYHTANVLAYWKRMRIWLLRFRGVATRYLEHYLLWHQLIDASRWIEPASAFSRWPLQPL
jgi:transposase-like protein